jgi:hypothetical protein
MNDKIKCATNNPSAISEETRRKMDADRKLAQARQDGCTCASGAQAIGCKAYDKGTCLWHPDNDPYGQKERRSS